MVKVRLIIKILHLSSVIIHYMSNSFRYRWTDGKWIILKPNKLQGNNYQNYNYLQSVWTTTRQVMAITRTLQTEDEYQESGSCCHLCSLTCRHTCIF